MPGQPSGRRKRPGQRTISLSEAAPVEPWLYRVWHSCRPSLAKDRRLSLIDFPIKEIIIAGPRMDLGPANLTAETAGMLVCLLLPYRGIRQPAIGTAKIFGRPYVACHPGIMRRTEHLFQPRSLPE